METKLSHFIPYARQSVSEEDAKAVLGALKGDFITRGPIVQAFEERVAEEVQAKYAVAFNSGTSALMAACFAAKITHFDRVLTTPNTFVATAGSALHFRAHVECIDIDRASGNMDLDRLEEVLNRPHTRGKTVVIPVHFAGIAVDMHRLDEAIADPDTIVIEDAAHALGSLYPTGEKVGSCAYSAMTVFSFHPAKTITTGEGGMVTTNDKTLYEDLKLFRNNGIKTGLSEALTGNFHFTEFQAALGLSQLERLNAFVEKRRQLVQRYREKLGHQAHIRLFDPEFDARTAYHLFVAQIDFEALKLSREEVMQKLKEAGIGTQVHYIPLYRHPSLKALHGHYPEMEVYYAQALTLPLYYDLTFEDVDRIAEKLLAISKK